MVNVKQSFICEESQVVGARGTLPDRERLLVGDHRAGLEAGTRQTVGNKGDCLVAAHDVERADGVVPCRIVGGGEYAFIVIRVHDECHRLAFEIVHAGNADGFRLGFAQRGQKHPGQNRNDGDDDEQFNQSEG